MAKVNKDQELDELSKKSSTLVHGDDNSLFDENRELNNVVKNTISATLKKFGKRTNGNVINYFNEINLNDVFQELTDKKKSAGTIKTKEDFRRFMSTDQIADINSMLLSNSSKLVLFDNYDAIFKHIPECAQALETYKDSIISPDDYTKLIFNIFYDSADKSEIIDQRLDEITKKYKFESRSDTIIEKALLYGESYVSVLSLEDDISYMLNDPAMKLSTQNLNESEKIRFLDPSCTFSKLGANDISLTEAESAVFQEYFNITDEEIASLNESSNSKKKITKDSVVKGKVLSLINENITFGSKFEMLSERVALSQDDEFLNSLKGLNDIPTEDKKGTDGDIKKKKTKPLKFGLNGSSVKELDPRKIIDLTVDDICYGYYYVEDNFGMGENASYLGQSSGRDVKTSTSFAANNTISGTNNLSNKGVSSAATELGVSDEKLRLISSVFIDTFAKRVNKDYIKKNKKFRHFIHSLIKQKYIIDKPIKVTYFAPDEVVQFKVPAIYRKILFFAKLYLSILTNDLLIKLGRSHDKRVFYINTGLDQDYEQAVSKVIQDIKTKEYKMENINEINTILNLNPGRFDDYYMPVINGDRPVEIDTLQGMDTNSDNDFLEFLRNSMLSGIGVPKSLIDALSEIDFARTLSAQNAVFLRSVIKYQKALAESFTKLFRILYKNEYRFSNSASEEKDNFDPELIRVEFPSPGTLNYSNLADLIQTVDGNASFIAQQIVVPGTGDVDGEDKVNKLKAEIVKDMLPNVDWDKYSDFYKKVIEKKPEDDLIKKITADPAEDAGQSEFGY